MTLKRTKLLGIQAVTGINTVGIMTVGITTTAELGCLVCKRPPQLHHIRVNTGIGRRSSDWCVIPLCMDHHTGKFSIHGSKKTFVEQMGTELDRKSVV